MVTSGHVTKMAVIPFDPPLPKTPAIRKLRALSAIEPEGEVTAAGSVTSSVAQLSDFRRDVLTL